MSCLRFCPICCLTGKRFPKKRQDKIKNDLDTAAADKADARKLKEDYNAKIQNINAEAEEILAQARQKALDNEAKIIAEAKEEAARILSRANAQVDWSVKLLQMI